MLYAKYFISVINMSPKPGSAENKEKARLSIDEWLGAALEALANYGPEVLTIEKLCKHLGVSRGSFYWHFKNRDDFIKKLVQYWDTRLTNSIAETTQLVQEDPSQTLMFLMDLITETNAGRYDIPIRSWAATNPHAAAAVKQTDTTRYNFVKSLFSGIGFSGDELEIRVRAFVVYFSMERALTIEEKPKERKRRLTLLHQLLTQRV